MKDNNNERQMFLLSGMYDLNFTVFYFYTG